MITIGVDSHKAHLLAVAIDDTGRALGSTTVAPTSAGIGELRAWGAEHADARTRQWGIEGSGSYGRRLAQALVASGESVFEVPGIATAGERRRSRGREREKSDATDALAIARVTLRDAGRLPRISADGAAYQCKLLTEHRDNLILARTRALNQLYAHLDARERVERAAFRAARGRVLLERLATATDPAGDSVDVARAAIVRQLAQLVRELDTMSDAVETELARLAPEVAPSLLSIRGVGALTATKLLAEAGNIARFASAAKFAAYAGVAPLEASSGDRRRHRLSRRGNRQLNCAIHVVAVTQRRWHPPAKEFLNRKIAEGKSRKEALRSLKRHLSNVLFRALQADAHRKCRPSVAHAA